MPRPTAPAAMTPTELDRIARALYGDQWRSQLARALGVSDSSIKMMALGQRVVHAGIAADIAAICRARAGELMAIADEIEASL